MRRAEKAGRESADRILSGASISTIRAEIVSGASDREIYADRSGFLREIGAHNLSGRALQAALDAYDRGYRNKLKEALADLEKPVCPSCDRRVDALVRCMGRTVCPECSGYMIVHGMEGDED